MNEYQHNSGLKRGDVDLLGMLWLLLREKMYFGYSFLKQCIKGLSMCLESKCCFS